MAEVEQVISQVVGVSKTKTTEAALAFRGNFTHSLDAKGRISLPVEFRRTLEDAGESKIVITNYISDGARCLEGFALKSWMLFERKLRKKSRFNAKLQKLEHFYLSRAAEVQIDSSGRILIPSYLRTYAGVEKEATFTASTHGFRLWDKRVWDHIFAAAEQALLEDPEIFAEVDT